MAYDFGNDFRDGYQARPYKYRPKFDDEIERCPDKLKSSSRIACMAEPGKDIRLVLEVRGLGVIVMRASDGHPDGRVRFEGVSLITKDQLEFDN